MTAIRGIRDSEVVQIDSTEKLRIRKARDCVCQVADLKTGGYRFIEMN